MPNEKNIILEINLIVNTMPEGLTPLENLRYLYIELGKIFNYDYRAISDANISSRELNFDSNYIGNYQTCIQISEIFKILINGLVKDAHAEIIKRENINRPTRRPHEAVSVTIPGYKLILDLTLDLANIQSGFRTKHFGFETDSTGEYDIISLRECREMDKKLLFIGNKYTDEKLLEYKAVLDQKYKGLSEEEIIKNKIIDAKDEVFNHGNAKGYEVSTYIANFMNILLGEEIWCKMRTSNLFYKAGENTAIITLFYFEEYDLYYRYSEDLGFNQISYSAIQNLFKAGWETNSSYARELFEKREKTL